jgi:hypothetical protein
MGIQPKKKKCDGCGEDAYIWKNVDGKRYCKQCSSNTGVAKPSNTKPTTRQKPIPPRSQKRSKEERLYLAKRIIFLQEHEVCMIHLPGICTNKSTDIHHLYWGSSRNAHFIDFDNVMAVCRSCHDFIHTKLSSEEAISKGFKKII